MKYCPECGTKRFEVAKFCHECGKKFSDWKPEDNRISDDTEPLEIIGDDLPF